MRAAGNLATGRWNPHESAAHSGYGVRDATSEWQNDHQFSPVALIPRATGDDKLMEHAYQVQNRKLRLCRARVDLFEGPLAVVKFSVGKLLSEISEFSTARIFGPILGAR